FKAITQRVRRMVDDGYACWRQLLKPALAKNSIRILDISALDLPDVAWLLQYYRAQVRPVLTPLGIDPAHPFPQLLNKSLNLIVQVETMHMGEVRRRLAVVQVPRVLPRLVRLPHDQKHHYTFLGALIGHYLADLFPGTKIL